MSPAGNWSDNLRYVFSQKLLGWSYKIVQKKAEKKTYHSLFSLSRSEQYRWSSGAFKMFHVARRDIVFFQERSADHHLSTYVTRAVGVEGRIMDDNSSILNVDCSSALEVACGPPEIGAKF
jgi:hypothetical protein